MAQGVLADLHALRSGPSEPHESLGNGGQHASWGCIASQRCLHEAVTLEGLPGACKALIMAAGHCHRAEGLCTVISNSDVLTRDLGPSTVCGKELIWHQCLDETQ